MNEDPKKVHADNAGGKVEAIAEPERHYVDVYSLADVAAANELPVEALIEVALTGAFALIVPTTGPGEWSPMDRDPNSFRALHEHGEIDPTDPEAAKLLVREWSFVRVIEWFPHVMCSGRVIKRGDLLVRASGVPIEDLGGGVRDVGLKLPGTSPRHAASANEGNTAPRMMREDLRRTYKKIVAAMAAELAAVKKTPYEHSGAVNVDAIAKMVATRSGEDNDAAAKDTTRAYHARITEALKEAGETNAKG